MHYIELLRKKKTVHKEGSRQRWIGTANYDGIPSGDEPYETENWNYDHDVPDISARLKGVYLAARSFMRTGDDMDRFWLRSAAHDYDSSAVRKASQAALLIVTPYVFAKKHPVMTLATLGSAAGLIAILADYFSR